MLQSHWANTEFSYIPLQAIEGNSASITSLSFTFLDMSQNLTLTEDLYLKAAIYPILTSQFLGYFPLRLKQCPKTKRISLNFSYSSVPFIVAISQLFLTVFCALSFLYYFKKLESLQNTQSDGISMAIMTSMVFLNTFAHRLFGLYMSKSTVSFWNFHCNLWNKYFQTEAITTAIQDKLNKLGTLNRSFAQIVSSSGLLYFILLLCVEYILKEVYLINIGLISNSIELANENFLAMLLILFSILASLFVMYLHALGILWVTVFPQFYCVNLEIIEEKIASLLNEKEFELKILQSKETVIQHIKTLDIFICEEQKMLFKSTFENKEESKVISEVVKMYHATVEMVKQFNCRFSGKLLLETMFSILISLFFTYFILLWTLDGKYVASAMNLFPLAMAFVEIYYLGNVGSLLSSKNSSVGGFASISIGSTTSF